MRVRDWTMAGNAWRAVQVADTSLVEAGRRYQAAWSRVTALTPTDDPLPEVERAYEWMYALEDYLRAKETRLRAKAAQ